MDRRTSGIGSRLGRAALGFALAFVFLCCPHRAQAESGSVNLPPIQTLDDLAWAPMSNERLLVTTDGETTLSIFDSRGKRTGELYFPLPHIRDMRVLRDTTIVLGDRRTGRIYHVKQDGPLLGSAGARGLSEGQFLQLDRVDADTQGRLYGLDGAELRVLRFAASGELLGAYPVQTGPVVDSKGRVLDVQDRPSSGTRRLVAYETPKKSSVLYETKLEPEQRWEPIAALSDQTVLMRIFDASGKCSVARIDSSGKQTGIVHLAEDAVLAGPARVIAVDPEEKHLFYLAGGQAGYRIEKVDLPR